MRRISWMVPFVLLSALAACGGKGQPDKVLARVNGLPITESEYQREVDAQPPYVRPILETADGQKQFLDRMITLDLLMQEAVRRGLDRRPDVRSRLEQARRALLFEALIKDAAEKAPGLTDEALRKFYDANQASFQVGERVAVSHVLVKEKEKAEAFAAKARQGTSFEELIREALVSGGTGADLGFIERGSFVREFEEAAFKAAPNSIVGPVKSSYGFHVLKVGEKRPAGLLSFEEVKPKIASELREGAQRDAVDTLVTSLKKQARVDIVEAKFRKEAAVPAGPPAGAPSGAPAGPEPAGAAPGGAR